MTILFTPQRILFNGVSIAAGAGTINQATYTVPAGKRAELYSIWLLMAANAATAGTGTLRCIAGGTIALNCQNNIAAGQNAYLGTLIDLQAGETVFLQTAGGAAAAIVMSGTAFIREYG